MLTAAADGPIFASSIRRLLVALHLARSAHILAGRATSRTAVAFYLSKIAQAAG